jgi:DNA-binding beta-propeller fold protein YncE
MRSFALVGLLVALAPGIRAGEPKNLLEWGERGTKPGEFHSPIHIVIGPKDEVFVADLNNARIQQFTTEGKFVTGFDLPIDQPPRKSTMVGGLAIDKDHLYVAYMIQHKIGVFTYAGKPVREWGKKGTGDGEFNQPGGMVLRADGTILVADQCNHRIQVFDATGKFLRKWGEHGSKPGQFGGFEPAGSRFAGPHFLAQDSQGRIYTTEGVLGRVQQFDPDGKPLAAWGSKTKEPGAFGEYNFGKLKNTFGPIGVFVDKRDRVWVSSLNDRVQGFTPEGKLLVRLDGTGEPLDFFLHPHGMATDRAGHFYVADAGNQRIVKFAMGR